MTIQPLQFGQTYHVYNRGNNRENLFVEPRNYPLLPQALRQTYPAHRRNLRLLPAAQPFPLCPPHPRRRTTNVLARADLSFL